MTYTLLACVTLATLTSTACDLEAQAGRATGSFERVLAVSGPVTLTITNGSGDVRITPGGGDAVHIAARITAHDFPLSTLSATQRVERLTAEPPIRASGNDIQVGDIPDRALRNNLRVDYDITVPVRTQIHSRSGSGDQRIGAIDGPANVAAGSGDLVIGPLQSHATLTTGSGDITLLGASGDITVTAGSGDVAGAGLRGRVTVKTGSGSIDLEGRPERGWTIGAASGDVSLRVPPDLAFTVQASTASGHIRVNRPMDASTQQSSRSLSGTSRGGGAPIAIATASGSIRID